MQIHFCINYENQRVIEDLAITVWGKMVGTQKLVEPVGLIISNSFGTYLSSRNTEALSFSTNKVYSTFNDMSIFCMTVVVNSILYRLYRWRHCLQV